jgi:O-acetylhomoserine (thiol)-lyase
MPHGVPLIVDNTVHQSRICAVRSSMAPTSWCIRSPNTWAATAPRIGGAIVDSGKFPWSEHKARFKRLNEPDVSYHGVVYTEALWGRQPTLGGPAWCHCATWAPR